MFKVEEGRREGTYKNRADFGVNGGGLGSFCPYDLFYTYIMHPNCLLVISAHVLANAFPITLEILLP